MHSCLLFSKGLAFLVVPGPPSETQRFLSPGSAQPASLEFILPRPPFKRDETGFQGPLKESNNGRRVASCSATQAMVLLLLKLQNFPFQLLGCIRCASSKCPGHEHNLNL